MLAAVGLCACAAAAEAPQPPCAGVPLPRYPDIDAPPAVRVWERSAWNPPPCTGWQPLSQATVVATAARFGSAGGVDGLRRRIGAVSGLEGLRYWSTTSQRWQPLILTAWALSGPDLDRRRPDFSLDEIAAGRTLYLRQEDNIFGKAAYRLRIREVSATRLVFAAENAGAIRYLGIPAFQPGDIQSICFLEQESKDAWRYYSLARFGGPAGLLNEASLINRAVASYRYLAGIPADREPPAAR